MCKRIMKLVGRKKEIGEPEDLYRSGQAEFVAVLGRRRVGKTYLVNELFSGRLFFQHAGLSPVEAKEAPKRTQLEAQLNHFVRSLQRQGAEVSGSVKSWGDAFFQLERFLGSASRSIFYEKCRLFRWVLKFCRTTSHHLFRKSGAFFLSVFLVKKEGQKPTREA